MQSEIVLKTAEKGKVWKSVYGLGRAIWLTPNSSKSICLLSSSHSKSWCLSLKPVPEKGTLNQVVIPSNECSNDNCSSIIFIHVLRRAWMIIHMFYLWSIPTWELGCGFSSCACSRSSNFVESFPPSSYHPISHKHHPILHLHKSTQRLPGYTSTAEKTTRHSWRIT